MAGYHEQVAEAADDRRWVGGREGGRDAEDLHERGRRWKIGHCNLMHCLAPKCWPLLSIAMATTFLTLRQHTMTSLPPTARGADRWWPDLPKSVAVDLPRQCLRLTSLLWLRFDFFLFAASLGACSWTRSTSGPSLLSVSRSWLRRSRMWIRARGVFIWCQAHDYPMSAASSDVTTTTLVTQVNMPRRCHATISFNSFYLNNSTSKFDMARDTHSMSHDYLARLIHLIFPKWSIDIGMLWCFRITNTHYINSSSRYVLIILCIFYVGCLFCG